jgi:predicted DNA-binding protein (UPF0251 family)
MRAALAVLPRVWAYAEPGDTDRTDQRKGPAKLVLVVPAEEQEPHTHEVPEEVAFYRKYTEGMLRRYVKLSMEAGRAPSLLGREMFRGNVTHYKVRAFDDVVIFVHDVGQCLDKLDRDQMQLVRRIAMQEYTQGEVAGRMGVSLRSVHGKYGQAIDRVTALFLERGLLEPRIACQEGERRSVAVTH